jgi:uracil-DNA glycosylase family 4
MSDALDYVHSTLQALLDSGADLRTPRKALDRLAATRGAATAAPARTVPATTSAPTTERKQAAPSLAAAAPAAVIVPGKPLPPFTRVAPATGSKTERIEALRGPVLSCTKCPNLVASRTQVVFGVGNPEAELMFVGEAPGADEDKQGEPFVGAAGQLLTKIIAAMGLRREDVFIANVLKCRPDMPAGVSGNRKPLPAEMQTCLPYLREQIEIIQPRALVALGATALEGLTGQNTPVGKLRGKWQEFESIPLMVTFHPAYLLRNQALGEKRKVWEDMLLVLEKLGHSISEKQRGFFLRKE